MSVLKGHTVAALLWVRRHQVKLRFLLAGGFNTLVGTAVFPLLMWKFGPRGLHYMVALVIAQVVCVSSAYVVQKLLVFRTRGNFIQEIRKFGTFYVYNFLFNLAALPFLIEICHLKPIGAQLILTVLVVSTSYIWHSRITFRPPGART